MKLYNDTSKDRWSLYRFIQHIVELTRIVITDDDDDNISENIDTNDKITNKQTNK